MISKIKDTPTGAYYRMSDGRIGYVTKHYARISVKRCGFRNGKLFLEDNEIGDRVYQINKKITIKDDSYWTGERIARVPFKDQREGYLALVDYDQRNCQPQNTINYIIKLVNDREDNRQRYTRHNDENTWNDGYQTGVNEVKENVEYYMNKILNTI